MKVKLLKELRSKSWGKYEIQNWSNVVGCGDKPWRICDSPKTALAFHEYATKEEAIEATKSLWHDDATKYLWEHRTERKCNKYPW